MLVLVSADSMGACPELYKVDTVLYSVFVAELMKFEGDVSWSRAENFYSDFLFSSSILSVTLSLKMSSLSLLISSI